MDDSPILGSRGLESRTSEEEILGRKCKRKGKCKRGRERYRDIEREGEREGREKDESQRGRISGRSLPRFPR